MPERRYSRYKREDVWLAMASNEDAYGISLLPNSVIGNSVSLIKHHLPEAGSVHEQCNKLCEVHHVVVLARSSDWYYYSLNSEDWHHGVTAVVCGTHDSCLSVPALAMDTRRWYDAGKMRSDFGPLAPVLATNGKPIGDKFESARRTQYGHNMLIGALMCERKDAHERLKTFKQSTRLRIEAKIKQLKKRRAGHPLIVRPPDQPVPEEQESAD